MFPQFVEVVEPMPEMPDQHIGAEILLPTVNQMARGHVVAQSCDAQRNAMSRAHENPILDTGCIN